MQLAGRILVISDWDADGVVASALAYYSQSIACKYPVEECCKVDLKPVEPLNIYSSLSKLSESYEAVMFLDIPFLSKVASLFKMLREHFNVGRLIYIDHHISTISFESELRKLCDEIHVSLEATSTILYKVLLNKGVKVHEKLKMFTTVISYMDRGLRVPNELLQLLKLASSISKILTIKRDPELYEKIVAWLVDSFPSPLPFDTLELRMLERKVKEVDEELNRVVMDLAITGKNIGYLKFIDASNYWKRRGATSLVLRLGRLLKSPVAVVFRGERGKILIVKASHSRAYRIAKYFIGEGLAEDIAGHPNLAIIKLSKEASDKLIEDALRKACYYV
ncbi:MAG: phosphoesterase [Desulfurococcaceae archaeon]